MNFGNIAGAGDFGEESKGDLKESQDNETETKAPTMYEEIDIDTRLGPELSDYERSNSLPLFIIQEVIGDSHPYQYTKCEPEIYNVLKQEATEKVKQEIVGERRRKLSKKIDDEIMEEVKQKV